MLSTVVVRARPGAFGAQPTAAGGGRGLDRSLVDGATAREQSVGMTKHGGSADETGPRVWKGDAVEERPGAEAELAADRAEGNSPIPAEAEQERLRAPTAEQQPERMSRRTPRGRGPGEKEDPEEKIEETAEEHQARRETGERPPRGKL
jgi:hypothetical protein